MPLWCEPCRRWVPNSDTDSGGRHVRCEQQPFPPMWRCDNCDYIHPHHETPIACPNCDVGQLGSWSGHVPADALRRIEPLQEGE